MCAKWTLCRYQECTIGIGWIVQNIIKKSHTQLKIILRLIPDFRLWPILGPVLVGPVL